MSMGPAGNIVAVSDLHLGAPSSLLALPSVKERLIGSLRECGDITCFLLLGDILDLTMAPGANAWNKASVFFHDVFRDVARDASIYYVPGNHDHHMWTLLLERRGIVSPLEEALGGAGRTGEAGPVLEPLELTGGFGPDDRTFVHALFPQHARDRLYVAYPFVRLPGGQEKPLIAHHGHYFDRKIMPLAARAAARYKDDVGKVEECNFAWVESLFYFSSIGRTSREFLTKVYTYYDMVKETLGSLSRLTGIAEKGTRGKRIGKLPVDRIKNVMFNLFEQESYVLVFGHTHAREHFCGDAGTIKMYTIGGWLVEKCSDASPTVSPAIFQARGSQFDLLPFAVESDEIRVAAAKAKNVSPIR